MQESNVVMLPVAKAFPQVGDSIAIAHTVKRNPQGEVQGMTKVDRASMDTITRVYLDGTVGTGIGDVWKVKLAGDVKNARGAKWVTINPAHGD